MDIHSPKADLVGISAVLETALDAVVVMDTDGIVRGWNRVAVQTFGLALDDVLGRRMSDLIIPHRYRKAHERGLAHFLSTGEGPVLDSHLEIEGLCSDGREIPVELSITYTEHFGEPLFLGFLRDISERKKSEQRQKLLVDELNHRVKNLLGVVSGLAYQTGRNATSVKDFTSDFNGRLAALGRSHELLTAATWERASLRALLEAFMEPYLADEAAKVSLSGDDIALAPKQFIAIGMVLYELLTNSVKYGALSRDEGRLELSWNARGEEFDFNWREIGQAVKQPQRTGFGMQMIDASMKHTLNGSASFNWTMHGLIVHLAFRLT